MGTFYVFLRKFFSFCGLCIEEDELKKPLINGLNAILDTEIENDLMVHPHRNSSSRNKADVYSSIKGVASGQSLSACSLRNSLESPCGTTTNYDCNDSLREKLTGPRKTSTEPGLESEINKNEQLTEEVSMSPRSGHRGLNSINTLCDNVNAVSVPNSQQPRSSENGCILAETDSSSKLVSQKVTSEINLKSKDVKKCVVREKSSCTNHLMSVQQSPNIFSSSEKSCSVNGSTIASLNNTTVSENLQSDEQEYLCIENSVEENNGSHEVLGPVSFVHDHADSPENRLTCLRSTITVLDSTPIKRKKKGSRRKNTKTCLLNNQNGQLIVEASTSDPQSLNAVNGSPNAPLNETTLSENLQSEEQKSLFIENSVEEKNGSHEDLGSVSFVHDHADSPKNGLTCLINVLDSTPIKRKKKASRRKSTKTCLLNNQNGQLNVEASTSDPPSLNAVNGSTNAALDKTTVSGYFQSEDQESLSVGNENYVEEKNGSNDSLGSDSPKVIATFLQDCINEPDSTPVKSKKKASKRKSTKTCLLNNQNGQLIVEASSSDPRSLNTFEQISNNGIAIGVSYCQLLGSTENGCILVEPDSLPIKLGSKKKSDTIENRRGVKQWVAKEECSAMMASLLNGSAYSACKKLSGHLNSEFSYAADELEFGDIQRPLEGNTSPKTQLVPNKTTSATNLKQKVVQLWVPKEKSNSSGHPRSTQQSLILVPTSEKPFLVDGSTYDDALKKTTLVEFSAAPAPAPASEEQESPYVDLDHSLKIITSPTNAAVVVERKFQGYCSSHKILLVGEGNFSFSACLARAFDSAASMVATSLNSKEYLKCYYKGALDNLSELQRRGCKVLHDVDATAMENHSSIKGQLFDRIIYNFPHCGDFSLTKCALRKNQTLVRLFMENSSKMIVQGGEIHIRHKTTPSFLQWDIKELASEAGLVLIEEARFHFRKFEGYETKYGFEGFKFSSDDNFNCYPCRTYKFALPQHQKEMGRGNSKLKA